jgi:protein-tyrosine phosphatase
MLRILPNLYLAAEPGASDLDILNTANVRACVNCSKDLPCYFETDETFKYFTVPVNDTPSKEDNDEMLAYLEPATAFIQEHLTANNPVVVYCKRAVQASPSVIAAYIVKYLGKSLRRTVSSLQLRRPRAFFPRAYFREALLAWQDMCFQDIQQEDL